MSQTSCFGKVGSFSNRTVYASASVLSCGVAVSCPGETRGGGIQSKPTVDGFDILDGLARPDLVETSGSDSVTRLFFGGPTLRFAVCTPSDDDLLVVPSVLGSIDV